MQTIICIKWGNLYSSLFVNRLWSSIQRNTDRPTRLICYTDDSSGIDAGIITQPLPAIDVPSDVWSVWRKISLFRPDLTDGENLLSGDILFMDLDIVITGNIDRFFDYSPGRFCIVHNPTRVFKRIGNTSIYRFRFGSHSGIYDNYALDPKATTDRYMQSQRYVSAMISDKVFWRKGWVVSFRRHLLPFWPLNFFMTPRLPSETICVLFTTHPKQDEAASGTWHLDRGWKRLYKYVKPTSWITEHWR